MSSARIRDTSFNIRNALSVMSSRLPTGVGMRYNFAINIIPGYLTIQRYAILLEIMCMFV